ncbi:hypothetical protein PL321_10985 [Caloramator sp. mosi_1]|uniref:hypothetical protein n=1 Tax=Caloramator sp. mosi_1 TaxID=3023090 RepID=UPI002362CDFE|nr:hypothetical protein [Caloramator sp. mosi_1]WDC83294.1 hypothetical protein PL321_10985 [Caloramator sp. mosi_1]
MKYFHVIFADEGKVEKIKYLLEQDEYKINFIEKRDKIKISWSFIFTDFNIKFYGTLMMLLFLSIVMYYVHRLKEIGILKLNGWSDRKIISRLFLECMVK